MTKYFQAINNDNNIIIDDSTSRFALIRNLPLSSMSATLIIDDLWESSWLRDPYIRVAPPYNKRIERVLAFKFSIDNTENIVGFLTEIDDWCISVYMERSYEEENTYNIFVFLGTYRTSYKGNGSDIPLEIAKKIQIYTFGSTKDINSVKIINKENPDYYNVYYPLNDDYGFKITNSLKECVFHSSCRYMDVKGDINKRINFSNSKKQISELADYYETGYSKNSIIIPNSNFQAFCYVDSSYAMSYSYCPTIIAYSILDNKIIMRIHCGYLLVGAISDNIYVTSAYVKNRIFPLGTSNRASCTIVDSERLRM